MELYRTYGTLGEEDNDVTWVAPTPMLFRLYKAFREHITSYLSNSSGTAFAIAS